MEPLRILHVVGTMDFGGVETLLMTIFRQIDREKLQFDFLCHNSTDCKFSEEIKALGGKMYMVHGPRHVGLRGYEKELFRFFQEHPEYKIIHCHKSDNNGLILKQAKRAGVPHRISHCHIADCTYAFPMSVLIAYSRFLNKRCLTERFACSKDAGDYLFGKKATYTILPNALSVQRFAFDAQRRQACRKELGVSESEVLIGHVGRFAEQKNHRFLLHAFAGYHQKNPDSKLLLLGGGDLERDIRALTAALKLKDAVIFGGLHKDLGGFYSAMDLFLFPSLFEGLCIVAVEAQCSGLPVIASENVPKEAKVTDRMQFLPLDAPLETWVNAIDNALITPAPDRTVYAGVVAESMFNIETMAAFLQDYYLKL